MKDALRRPQTLFVVAAVILLGVGAWGVQSARQSISDGEWVTHTADILRQLDDLATNERRAVAAQRGYLLTSEIPLRDEFWEQRARVEVGLQALDEAIADSGARRVLQDLAPRLERRLEVATRTLEVFERDGLDAARAFIATNGSRDLDREIRARMASLRGRELDLLRERRAALDRSARLSLLSVALGIPLSLLMLAFAQRVLAKEGAERRRAATAADAAAREARTLSAEMAALTSYAGMLQSCDDTDEMLAVTAQALPAVAPGVAGTVFLLRASRDHAAPAAQWGTHAVLPEPHPEPGQCWAMRRHQAYACADVRTGIPCTHYAPAADGGDASTYCVPLSAQGTVIGWVMFSRPGAGPIAQQATLLQAAEQLSLALANVRLKEDLRNQSIRDPLTGLFNRRYLEESLGREIARCRRRELPLAVMMFDIDHFKSFNDRFGHPGGDALLASFGRLLQAHCRPEDIACRLGGEEFTLILPEADLDTARQRAAAVLDATARMVATHDGAPLGRVTTSIGLAALPLHGSTGPELIQAADRALYRAKAGGRNRACVAEGADGDPVVLGPAEAAG